MQPPCLQPSSLGSHTYTIPFYTQYVLWSFIWGRIVPIRPSQEGNFIIGARVAFAQLAVAVWKELEK